MPDRELEFVDRLIKVFRQAQTFFRVFALALILAGISTLVWLLLHFSSESNKIFYGATGGITCVFGGIPVCFFYAARGNEIYLCFFKEKWQDAQEEHDLSALEKLNNELNDYRINTLSKPFWSIK